MISRNLVFSISAFIAMVVSLPVYAAATDKPGSIRVIPSSIVLSNLRDERKVLVSVKSADGFWKDVTSTAKMTLPTCVTKNSEGYLKPVRPGSSVLKISVGGQTRTIPITVKSTVDPPISFVKDIMPIMARTGCNAGTCHGSAKGKNGFKLSLRGYDPDYDYHALIDDISGRRFNRAEPAQSLMLLKATQGVAHQGGLIFEENSRYYPILYKWIADGVKSDVNTAKRAKSIEVLPDKPKIALPGDKQQLMVLAHYPDGSTRDVTREAVFTSTMPETATITPAGAVTAVRRGEASILVRYEGNYAADGMTIIGDRTGYKWAGQPQLNYIDKLVDNKLLHIKAIPSGLCTDSEFLRRVSIDVTGLPPTPEQVRAFVADKTPVQVKRNRLVAELTGSKEYVDNWTNKWSDLLSVNRKFLGERGTWKFRNWIREQVANNEPYNSFVRQIITASGSTYDHPAASYWRVAREPNQATENVTQLFLGIRFSCNKCHDHPFERWTQTQYYQFAANFGRIGYQPGIAEGDEDIFDKSAGEVTHPRLNKVMQATYPYTIGEKLTATDSRREGLANWLTSSKNPYFAKSFVNRIWSYFLGRGIIDPVDDIRSSNPAVNPELLDALTRDYIDHGFDTKRLIQTICASRTYQATIKTNQWNFDDNSNFSHALPRRLTAEQLVDALSRATGSLQRYAGVPEGFRAVQLPDSSVAAGGFLDLFGRPVRESPCECERSSTVSLGQTLNLVNGPTINDAIHDTNGRLSKLMNTDPTDKAIIEDTFLSALCRMPSQDELKKSEKVLVVTDSAIKEVMAGKNGAKTEVEAKKLVRLEAAQDILWALINSPSFLFNR
ncbi:MAG: DUF1553 domain-containing protein [Chthonomonadales bacterium]